MNFFFDILKRDDAQRMVYGYCSTEKLDSQGEIVEKAAIREAWDDYIRWANLREMHQPSAVGVVKEYSFDDTGCYIGAKVVDDAAWTKVVEGVYKGFSIGGKKLEKVGNRVTRLKLGEISLVDRPANDGAVIEMFKLDGGADIDPTAEAVALLKTVTPETEPAVAAERVAAALAVLEKREAPKEEVSVEVADEIRKSVGAVADDMKKLGDDLLAKIDAVKADAAAQIADLKKAYEEKLEAVEKKAKEDREALEARIKKLEDQPAPPKGATRAVPKTGDTSAGDDDVNKITDDDDALAAIKKIHASGGKAAA